MLHRAPLPEKYLLWYGTVAAPATSKYWSYGTWSNLCFASAYSQEWHSTDLGLEFLKHLVHPPAAAAWHYV